MSEKCQPRTSPHACGYARTRVALQLLLCGFGNLERHQLRARRALADARALLRPWLQRPTGYCPEWALIFSSISLFTASRLNEAGACIGGYSMALFAKSSDPLLHVDEAPQLAAHEIVEVTGGALVHGLTLYRRCPLERVLTNIDRRRHVRRVLLSRPAVGLLDKHELEIVEPDCAKSRSPEIENFMPRRRPVAQQQVQLIVPVQMVLVRPAT